MMVDYREASKLTGIKTATLYALVSRKRIPHFRLSGRIVRFDDEELRDWLNEGHVEAQGMEAEQEGV